MSEDIELKLVEQRESWFNGWFRWCPTSLADLRDAEKRILSNLKSSYHGQYVNVGCTVGHQDNHIWTVTMNEESPKAPIVLIHGFGSGAALWCLSFDSIAAHRPVYAFDVIGFGRSSRPNFAPEAMETEKEFIRTLEAWRKELKLEKFIAVGHSFGAFLATSYAIKYPERIHHLILADPWGFPDRPLGAERRKLPIWMHAIDAMLNLFSPLFVVRFAGPWGQKLLEKAEEDLIQKFQGMIPDAQEIIADYMYHCNAQPPSGESAFHTMLSGLAWAKYPMMHRMDSLKKDIPITMIYGAQSWVQQDPGFQIQHMRQKSYVDLQIIQGAGHNVYADKAEIFNNLINQVGTYVDDGRWPELKKGNSEASPTKEDFASKQNAMVDFRNQDVNEERNTNEAE